MHIPDGILPLPITLGGYAASISICWLCIRATNKREDPWAEIPKAALLTAAFFVASLIHIPIPPGQRPSGAQRAVGRTAGCVRLSGHPDRIVPPGRDVRSKRVDHPGRQRRYPRPAGLGCGRRVSGVFGPPSPRRTTVFGFLAGFSGITLSVLLFALILLTSLPAHLSAAAEHFGHPGPGGGMTHVLLAVLEGLLTGLLAGFLLRVHTVIMDGV